MKLQERLITGLRRGIYCTAVSVNALIAINEQAAINVLIFISFFYHVNRMLLFCPFHASSSFLPPNVRKKSEHYTSELLMLSFCHLRCS